MARASEILGVRPELAQSCLDELVRQQGVVRDPVPIPGFDDGVAGIYLLPFHRAEVSLAAGLLRLRSVPEQADRRPCPARRLGGRLRLAGGGHRQPARRRAGDGGPARPDRAVAVLTGGPGCGKSFTVRAVVAPAQPRRPGCLAAPTGRAAKRPSEPGWTPRPCTGCPSCARAATPPQPGPPAEADLVVADEAPC